MRVNIDDYFSKEFIKFFICSGLSAVVNLTARIVFSLKLNYAIAVVMAYGCGMTTAFILNKIFVFNKKQGNTSKQFFTFFIVNMFGLCQTLLISLLLRNIIFLKLNYTFYGDEVAHFIGLGTTAFTSYIGHKYFTFKN